MIDKDIALKIVSHIDESFRSKPPREVEICGGVDDLPAFSELLGMKQSEKVAEVQPDEKDGDGEEEVGEDG